MPWVRVITLRIKSNPGGVATTSGYDLDSMHKTIELSAEYVAGITPARLRSEICGVVAHELVHCFQYDGHGTFPGGIIEGLADSVRLSMGLEPPHWKRSFDGLWDAGYDSTAYFLEYLCRRFGRDVVKCINAQLQHEYEEDDFWVNVLGTPVKELWADYCREQ